MFLRFFFQKASQILIKHGEPASGLIDKEDIGDVLVYNVSVYQQKHINMCQDTSETIVLNFWGLEGHNLDVNPRGKLEGASKLKADFFVDFPIDLDTAIGIDKKTGMPEDKLVKYLNEMGPFIFSIPIRGGSHAVVCIGADNPRLYFVDPLQPDLQTIRRDELSDILRDKKKQTSELHVVLFKIQKVAKNAADSQESSSFLHEKLQDKIPISEFVLTKRPEEAPAVTTPDEEPSVGMKKKI